MIETKKTNSYYSYNNRHQFLSDVAKETAATKKKEEPKFYNPCPLDAPFVEPKTLGYRIWSKIVDVFGWLANLFR